MTQINRRSFLLNSASLAGAGLWPRIAWSDEEKPSPGEKTFVLNLHFGSSCSVSSGLVQPTSDRGWQKGFFVHGGPGQSVNPNLNVFEAKKPFVFTSYHRHLAQITEDMCLVNGNSISLDHFEAFALQTQGSGRQGVTPEWVMAVAEHMVQEKMINPLVISQGYKTNSVQSIMNLWVGNFSDAIKFTSDSPFIGKNNDEIWTFVKERHLKAKLGPTQLSESAGNNLGHQLNILLAGIPQFRQLLKDGSHRDLSTKLSNANVAKLFQDHPDSAGISATFNNAVTGFMILAGMLAKSGAATGMTCSVLGEDHHGGGADVITARRSSAIWAQIVTLWQWLKEQRLDRTTTILITQEFGRTAYNRQSAEVNAVTRTGDAPSPIVCPGRDHQPIMGVVAINRNVPGNGSGARIGQVIDNLVPRPGTDLKGGYTDGKAYVSTDIVGSLLMRIYPNLFPTERLVRRHWPNFKEIELITKS